MVVGGSINDLMDQACFKKTALFPFSVLLPAGLLRRLKRTNETEARVVAVIVGFEMPGMAALCGMA